MRSPLRVALDAYAGPMPLLVVPICLPTAMRGTLGLVHQAHESVVQR